MADKKASYNDTLKKRIEEMNENTRKVVKKPYFKRIEEKYESATLMPTLERKKKILSSLRDLHSHIDFKEIEREQM